MEMEISFPGGARVDAAFGDFVVKTDQSPHNGGEGSAPPPFSLFLASIGTCATTWGRVRPSWWRPCSPTPSP